jgi:hypothetical protein
MPRSDLQIEIYAPDAAKVKKLVGKVTAVR